MEKTNPSRIEISNKDAPGSLRGASYRVQEDYISGEFSVKGKNNVKQKNFNKYFVIIDLVIKSIE